MLILIAMAQATSPSAPSPPQKIDMTLATPCERAAATDEDVIVCGRRDETSRYRIPPPASSPSRKDRAEWQVGEGASVSAETENVDIGGTPSNRVMLRLKIKF